MSLELVEGFPLESLGGPFEVGCWGGTHLISPRFMPLPTTGVCRPLRH
jgi:hypothetical protein